MQNEITDAIQRYQTEISNCIDKVQVRIDVLPQRYLASATS